ncbi:hypothetical protein HBI23_182400 [Parastagonospora nodorum]|nr:hypothetical protein HBI12_172630 [Parastagonospora nodorum]KAH5435060.1 hypothetical protein HBI47_079400 [Parastagonospora nodorum]KAH5647059.1 hypothetical protein HBI23_182400 [Parastagonospora nodorum]
MLALLATLLSLLPLSHSHPTTTNGIGPEETWTIPRLDMHMMSSNTGLPGNTWPPSAHFNSTISFDVTMPVHNLTFPSNPSNNITTTCTASFANGTLPSGRNFCNPPGPTEILWFEMSTIDGLGPRRPELAFSLHFHGALEWDGGRVAMTWFDGYRHITANNASEESGFLTCLEGRPLDGLRCGIGSYLSRREALTVNVVRIGGPPMNGTVGGEGRSQ